MCRNLSKDISHWDKGISNNLTQIKRTEEQISKIVEEDLQNKLRDWKIFECLGDEKPTPAFVNIAKKTSNQDTLNSIKDTNGRDFGSDLERNEHITNFYSNLLKRYAKIAVGLFIAQRFRVD